jgi:hypothetical protein
MPVGPYEDFPTCIAAIMRKEDVDREAASAICGKMEKQAAKIEVLSQGFHDLDPKNDKLYIKTFLIDASISGNLWGVSRKSIVDNIHSFIGKPLVLYKNAKGELDHPPDADAQTIADWNNIQEPFRIGTIVDVVRKEQYNQGPHDDQYFAIIEVTDKDARDVLHGTNQTLYVSPALADLHRNLVANRGGEVVGEESDNWVGMHLALVREPAYGIRKAQITAKCGGSEEVCIAQLRKARLAKQHCGFCVRTALLGVTSQVTNSDKLKTLTLSEQDNDTKKEETKTTTIEEKKVEESNLEKENQILRQKVSVLETKLAETGELKQQLTARIASLEEREIGRVLEAKVKDQDKRREKIRLYVAKGLTAADVEDIYRDIPGAEFISKKAKLEQPQGGRATLGQTEDDDVDKANARRLIAGGMY